VLVVAVQALTEQQLIAAVQHKMVEALALQQQQGMDQPAQLIPVVVAVVANGLAAQAVLVALAWWLFVTLVRNVAPVVPLLHLVETLFIHSRRLAHLRHNRRNSWHILQK
jgi:hypothetical protein